MLKVLFILFAISAVSGAVSIVLQRRPLYSVLSLVVTLISLAALYVTLQAQFIAAIQVIVYAGAIMVLFVFVIMLLNVKEDLTPDRHRLLRYLAAPVAILLIAEVVTIVSSLNSVDGLSKIDSTTVAVGDTASIGHGLFSVYLLPFEVTSILILMALVGAVVLAQRDRK